MSIKKLFIILLGGAAMVLAASEMCVNDSDTLTENDISAESLHHKFQFPVLLRGADRIDVRCDVEFDNMDVFVVVKTESPESLYANVKDELKTRYISNDHFNVPRHLRSRKDLWHVGSNRVRLTSTSDHPFEGLEAEIRGGQVAFWYWRRWDWTRSCGRGVRAQDLNRIALVGLEKSEERNAH